MSESVFIAFLGIAGTLIAGVLGTIGGFVGSFFLQWKQRKWAIEDRRREWKKEYREKQVKPLQTLVRTWLNNPDSFYQVTDQGYATDLPRGSAWSIPDESLREKALHFLELIGKYYHEDKARSSEKSKTLTEITAACSHLEIAFEKYVSEV